MAESAKKERLGIATLERFFASHGWLFREQLVHDFGIDAQVEIVEGEKPTGKLIAIQVKTGRSYFEESTDSAIIYRTDEKHIEYWVAHSMPVIVVLHDPTTDTTVWQSVTEDAIESTGKGWKLAIPKNKLLAESSLGELGQLTQPPTYVQRLNRLRLDRPWMEMVAGGEVVYVEFENWVNKSLPRFAVRVGCASREDIEPRHWPATYGPGLSYEDLLAHLIPWADFSMDEEAYSAFLEDQWADECYMGRDEDGKPYYSMPFDAYYSPPDGITPVYADGEVEGYRLLLRLNELGQGFLALDQFCSEQDKLSHRTFTFP